MLDDNNVPQITEIRQDDKVRDPLAAKLRAVEFFTPPTSKITPEQADALAPAPAWADRPDYERDWEDQDGDYWITEKATISVTDIARVSMFRETEITGTGVVAHTIESVRVGHAGEEFWIETRHVEAVFAQIHSAVAEAGVTL